jgi:hypothetical protein
MEVRMPDTSLALMDSGQANKRILSSPKYQTDFRSVEGASLKRRTALSSPEGKRTFGRCFYSFQRNAYVISTIGRTKLPHDSIEQIEQALRAKLDAASKELDKAIDAMELLLKKNNIDNIATYEAQALEDEAAITSGLGRRYFELIHKLDQVMPLIQTLEIEEALSEQQADHLRSHCKRSVFKLSSSARNFAVGVRRRMGEVDAAAAPDKRPSSREQQGKSASEDVELVAAANDQAAPLMLEPPPTRENPSLADEGHETPEEAAAGGS